MSTPGGTSGSQAAAVSQSVGSRPIRRPRLASESPTPPVVAGSAAPTTDSATVGNTDVVEVEDDVPVGSKRKLRSEVWKDFDVINVKGVWKARCMWCKRDLGGETRNGTTHLKNHLAICQDRACRKGLTQSTLKLSANPKDGSVTLDKYVFDQDVARKELALMIIVHEYPLSMVDHDGFKRFCAALQPAFKVVSRNTIRKDIFDMYQVQKQSMVNYIKKLSSRVAVTTDLWTANHQRKGYMAVTAHFVDDDWKVKSFLIRFIYVPAPHTAEVIAEVLHEVLLDWHIERNLSTITLDNCSVNDNLMKTMIGTDGDDLSKNKAAIEGNLPLCSCMLKGKLIHMRCAAHILNLIVKDGMSVMEKGIDKVRNSVAYWSATPKRHEKFEKMAAQMKGKYEKIIALDCKTIWNSTYTMLSAALLYQDVFERLASRAPFVPSAEDWKFARELCDRLKMFYDVTEVLSGTKYVTDGADTRPRTPTLRDDEDWMDTFDDWMSKIPIVTSTYVRTDLDLYLEEPLLPRTQDLDIIQWWQVAGLKYPTLRKIARDVLAIPVTTVASESAFSTSGRIISPHRSRLAPSMIEALMCMQAWSHNDMLGFHSSFVGALMTCLDEKDEEMDEDVSTIIDE